MVCLRHLFAYVKFDLTNVLLFYDFTAEKKVLEWETMVLIKKMLK